MGLDWRPVQVRLKKETNIDKACVIKGGEEIVKRGKEGGNKVLEKAVYGGKMARRV